MPAEHRDDPPTVTIDDDDADTKASIIADERAIHDVEHAANSIAAAKNLIELRDVLNAIDRACELTDSDAQHAYDASSLPNYGGEEPHDGIVYSWDMDSKLTLNDDGEWSIGRRKDALDGEAEHRAQMLKRIKRRLLQAGMPPSMVTAALTNLNEGECRQIRLEHGERQVLWLTDIDLLDGTSDGPDPESDDEPEGYITWVSAGPETDRWTLEYYIDHTASENAAIAAETCAELDQEG